MSWITPPVLAAVVTGVFALLCLGCRHWLKQNQIEREQHRTRCDAILQAYGAMNGGLEIAMHTFSRFCAETLAEFERAGSPAPRYDHEPYEQFRASCQSVLALEQDEQLIERVSSLSGSLDFENDLYFIEFMAVWPETAEEIRGEASRIMNRARALYSPSARA